MLLWLFLLFLWCCNKYKIQQDANLVYSQITINSHLCNQQHFCIDFYFSSHSLYKVHMNFDCASVQFKIVNVNTSTHTHTLLFLFLSMDLMLFYLFFWLYRLLLLRFHYPQNNRNYFHHWKDDKINTLFIDKQNKNDKRRIVFVIVTFCVYIKYLIAFDCFTIYRYTLSFYTVPRDTRFVK